MTLKTIAISEDNYQTLKKLGGAGDSFNDVITELIGRKGSIKERGTV
jgi:predicted CopG family antitoxin